MSLRDALHRSTRSGSADALADESTSPNARGPWAIAAVERELWLVAIGAMVADVVLTLYGLHVGLVENNPIARTAIHVQGATGLVVLKLVALCLAAGCWAVLPDRYGPVIPLGLAIPTLVAVVSNALLVTIVTL